MPGRLPIGRSDTERLLDALLNFEPPEKQEVWLFSTVRKRKGRRFLWGWADMGTGGFGSSDGNRRREKRGRRGTSIPPLVLLCYAMLRYVMLWILLFHSRVLRSLNLVIYLVYDIRPILSR